MERFEPAENLVTDVVIPHGVRRFKDTNVLWMPKRFIPTERKLKENPRIKKIGHLRWEIMESTTLPA